MPQRLLAVSAAGPLIGLSLLSFLAACGGGSGGGDDAGADASTEADAGADAGADADAGAPPGDPCSPNPCEEPGRTVCVEVDRTEHRCECDPGLVDRDGRCEEPTRCEADTCSGHGSCEVVDGTVRCTCDEGFAGEACEGCDEAAGYHDDGAGGCTTDPCTPDPCADDPSRTCVADDGGAASCECIAGFHDEGGTCVRDTSCMSGSCGGHGSCADDTGEVVCTCDEGYAGDYCGECDAAAGYHDDGAGGCTMDPCTPNPCTEANRSVCTAEGTGYSCACDDGYHLESGSCVVDETCGASTCSGHGSCSVVGGRTQCECDEGYVGDACAECDTSAGYHDDGAGGCTTDPCTPNPCTSVEHRTVCSPDAGSGYVCECESPYHDDGVGGCTTDPCVPDPCAASGQACRTGADGEAECYTPTCDDGEPCTVDSWEGSGCVFTPVADGTECSTTLCVSGELCTDGVCGGGSAVTCDDGNPCTVDSCDDVIGCEATEDDGLVPDDGIDCTVDTCSGGVPSHTPDDGACDDGLYCTGVETCEPTSSSADASGCVVSDVPEPPFFPANDCAYYEACDEASEDFPFVTEPAGTPCDDGIACTTSDQCTASGACVGTWTGDCSTSGTCAGTSALGGDIDIPVARVRGTITRGGTDLPQWSPSPYEIEIHLVAHDTGAWHRIHWLDYAYDSSMPGYRLDDPVTYETLVVPGVYDVLFERAYSGSDTKTVSTAPASDTLPHGLRILETGVTIGPGDNVLDVDIPVADVSGTVTTNGGAALPEWSPSPYEIELFLVAQDTGAWHRIHWIDYAYDSSMPGYRLDDSPSYATHVPPGTYDVLFSRAYSGPDNNTVSTAPASDTLPHGLRILQQDVTLSSGASTLDVDIPVADVSGTVTTNGGAALPEWSPSPYEIEIFLVAEDTGAWHRIHWIDYAYDSSQPGYRLDDPTTFTTHLPPGRYDVLYSRAYDGAASHTVQTTPSSDTIPHGLRYLSQVDLPSGASSITVDIPRADVAATVTRAGEPLPEWSPSPHELELFLRARDTRAAQRVHWIDYAYDSSQPGYRLDDSPSFDTSVLPGDYDVLYSRAWDGSDTNTVQTTPSSDTIPHGYRILRHCVAP